MRTLDVALVLMEIRHNQWLGREEIESIQLKKLNDLLNYASGKVPHYRNLSGIRLRDMSELPHLPLLARTSVRDNPESFISSEYDRKKLAQTFTSGSSGVQVPIYSTRGEEGCGIAFECHHLFENGVGPLDSQARITHFVSAPNILQKIGIMRCSYISVLKSENELLGELRSIRPEVLCAYPSLVRSLALCNRGLGFKMIFTGGELLHPDVRTLAEKSFGCPVRDRYGSMESSWVAWECEKGGYHVHSDQAIIEVVDENGRPLPEGKVGRMVVTPLWRKAMPLIRYALDDRGAMGGKCSCGRGLHVMKMIEGRDDDFIVLPSGKMRSARAINILDDVQEVLSYQIIQERPDHFVFRFIPAGDFLDEKTKNEIRRRIAAGCLNEPVQVEFEQVEAIARGRTGKIRTVISKVKPDGAG
jgi:phenylacetate-CoA ligase